MLKVDILYTINDTLNFLYINYMDNNLNNLLIEKDLAKKDGLL